MNELNENSEKREEEEILNPQETESVEGGVSSLDLSQDLQQTDDTNYVQCGCNNNKCGKAISQQ